MSILLIIAIVLLVLWLTGWRTNFARGRFSDERLIHILLVLGVIILAIWLLEAVI